MEAIQHNPFYKQILADSFGGVMYNAANKHKYDAGKETLLELWDTLSPAEQESAGGIMKGAIDFLKED